MGTCSRRGAVLVAALAIGLTACGGSTTTTASTTAATTAEKTPASPGASPTTAAPSSGVSNDQKYSVTRSTAGDATADGRGRWTLVVDTITGGDPQVAGAFNSAVHDSAEGQLEPVKTGADPDGTWTFETQPQIYFGGASVSELISGLFVPVPAAHPTSYISTVVIDSRTAKPITLGDLFADKQAGLDKLSEQTKLLLPAVSGVGPTPMPDEPGNAPTEANFANWIPTPDGLQIHFADYQFFHGTPTITVPWSALDGLLAPGMDALRT
ncbi:RsiV family protein [Mycolicibacterium vinylchloridicum]|uniref:RsiV family protein n=1 Tax=Mycolicibacterium vinylchloridicum TaxID=2736928 RepID=UPI0015CC7D39|nr:RsiV family protein [Mycolicibacterium vinylchloridicum]